MAKIAELLQSALRRCRVTISGKIEEKEIILDVDGSQ